MKSRIMPLQKLHTESAIGCNFGIVMWSFLIEKAKDKVCVTALQTQDLDDLRVDLT